MSRGQGGEGGGHVRVWFDVFQLELWTFEFVLRETFEANGPGRSETV